MVSGALGPRGGGGSVRSRERGSEIERGGEGGEIVGGQEGMKGVWRKDEREREESKRERGVY